MAAGDLELRPIDTLPGVQPITDKTAVNTQHYTNADKIRFKDGTVQKIGGWLSSSFDYGESITGTMRTIFTDVINGKYYTILGTDARLYTLIGSRLTNITPLQTASIAIANSLTTQYGLLGASPCATVNGTKFVTITDTDVGRLKNGDSVTISGSAAVGGIPAGEINATHVIRSITATTYSIFTTTAATSTTTGGGGAVNRATGMLTVSAVAHAQSNGDRVKLQQAVTFGGVLDTQINVEFIIRNVAANTFDIMTIGTATSSAAAGGGAATDYFKQIVAGELDEVASYGYGAGLYGVGLYGTALTSTTGSVMPRIWFADRYGDTIILTAGNQTGIYQWLGSAETAPTLITNAPAAINYAFVLNNIIVTFGSNNIENSILASDLNNITVWTSSSTNQVYEDDIEGSGRLISHLPVSDYSLVFTEYNTSTFRYIGLPFVWEVKSLDETIGIISPMARVSAKGIGFWMGLENFYMFRGGTIEVIKANSQNESTCLQYVFGDLNYGQKSKCFSWYNKAFNEVWFHYPSANSNECNRVVVVNILDFTWTIHTLDRTAAEYPNVKLKNPRLGNVGTIYQHELGNDANGAAMDWTITSDKRFYGRNNVLLQAVVPDSIQTHDVSFSSKGYLFPQSTNAIFDQTFTITPTTERVPTASQSRFNQFTWSGSAIGQGWTMGTWFEEVQNGAPK